MKTNPLYDLWSRPSEAELLQGDFPEWSIWRDVDDAGNHGDWVAQHATKSERMFRAPDIPALRNLLDEDGRREGAQRAAERSDNHGRPAPPDRG